MTRQLKSHCTPTSPEVPTHTQSDGTHFKEALSEGLHDTSVHMKEKIPLIQRYLTQTDLICGIRLNIKGLFNNLLNSRPPYH